LTSPYRRDLGTQPAPRRLQRLHGTSAEQEHYMAQETVERLLGRILTDALFRKRLFNQARDQLLKFDLLDHERESLSKLDPEAFEKLSAKLDPRIVRG
jgi:hypothetical protein